MFPLINVLFEIIVWTKFSERCVYIDAHMSPNFYYRSSHFVNEDINIIFITFCSGWHGILSPRGVVLLYEANVTIILLHNSLKNNYLTIPIAQPSPHLKVKWAVLAPRTFYWKIEPNRLLQKRPDPALTSEQNQRCDIYHPSSTGF